MAQLMDFTHGRFGSLHAQSEVGSRKTNILSQKLVSLSKLRIEKTIGKLETNDQTVGMSDTKTANVGWY